MQSTLRVSTWCSQETEDSSSHSEVLNLGDFRYLKFAYLFCQVASAIVSNTCFSLVLFLPSEDLLAY